MKIHDRNLTGAGLGQAGKTVETQKVSQNSSASTGASRASSPADRVELSNVAGGISRALAADAGSRVSRVASLAADYAAGRYQPDAHAVSRAMVSEAVAAGPTSHAGG